MRLGLWMLQIFIFTFWIGTQTWAIPNGETVIFESAEYAQALARGVSKKDLVLENPTLASVNLDEYFKTSNLLEIPFLLSQVQEKINLLGAQYDSELASLLNRMLIDPDFQRAFLRGRPEMGLQSPEYKAWQSSLIAQIKNPESMSAVYFFKFISKRNNYHKLESLRRQMGSLHQVLLAVGQKINRINRQYLPVGPMQIREPVLRSGEFDLKLEIPRSGMSPSQLSGGAVDNYPYVEFQVENRPMGQLVDFFKQSPGDHMSADLNGKANYLTDPYRYLSNIFHEVENVYRVSAAGANQGVVYRFNFLRGLVSRMRDTRKYLQDLSEKEELDIVIQDRARIDFPAEYAGLDEVIEEFYDPVIKTLDVFQKSLSRFRQRSALRIIDSRGGLRCEQVL